MPTVGQSGTPVHTRVPSQSQQTRLRKSWVALKCLARSPARVLELYCAKPRGEAACAREGSTIRRALLSSAPICVIAAAAAVPVAAVGRALAATVAMIHVDCAHISGIEDATPEHPYDTIQDRLDAAVDGGTVAVQPCSRYQSAQGAGR